MGKSDKRALTNGLDKRMVFTRISLNFVWKQAVGNYKNFLCTFNNNKLINEKFYATYTGISVH